MFSLFYNTIDNDYVKNYYNNIKYTDNSGIDLIVSENTKINPNETVLVGTGIFCEPDFNSGYYLYPRSSIYKYNLTLSNTIGIIDKNYRGEIKMALKNLSDKTINLHSGLSLCQLCHPSLVPMKLIYKEKLNETDRGDGGFGSTR